MTAGATDMHRHIFHDPEYRNIDLQEHLNALFGVQQGNILRCGNNYCPGYLCLLRHGQLNITGAWRHIHHQHIQLTPGCLLQKLQ